MYAIAMSRNYQFFANPIKPFILQHYDFKWVDNVRKMSANAYYLDLLNLYLSSDTLIKADILTFRHLTGMKRPTW
jgi:hypothetical protein